MIDTDRVHTIPIPVPGNRDIAGLAQCETVIHNPRAVAVAQIEGAILVDTNRVDAIPVPISGNLLDARRIARRVEIERDIRITVRVGIAAITPVSRTLIIS